MEADEILFFSGHEELLALYEALRSRLLADCADDKIKVSKTQISFACSCIYAMVSFPPKGASPAPSLRVSFGLPYALASARIRWKTEPYPNRWTHHALISAESDIDAELMGWLREARAFAGAKTRARGKRI